MENSIAIILLTVVTSFGFVVFFGAPFLPTRSPQILAAFDLLNLKKGATLLELGCGDGKVLIAAAERGYHAIGIEINPILACIAWVRTRKYGKLVQVRFGNFWKMKWPSSDGVFVFLLDRYMPALEQKMNSHGGKLVSVAFKIPNKNEIEEKNGDFLYKF